MKCNKFRTFLFPVYNNSCLRSARLKGERIEHIIPAVKQVFFLFSFSIQNYGRELVNR